MLGGAKPPPVRPVFIFEGSLGWRRSRGGWAASRQVLSVIRAKEYVRVRNLQPNEIQTVDFSRGLAYPSAWSKRNGFGSTARGKRKWDKSDFTVVQFLRGRPRGRKLDSNPSLAAMCRCQLAVPNGRPRVRRMGSGVSLDLFPTLSLRLRESQGVESLI